MKIRILTILIFVFTCFSCDEYLDLRPPNGTVRQDFWKTKEDVQAAVIGIYSEMVGNASFTERLFMYGELRGDMVIPGQNASDNQIFLNTTNILPTNALTEWSMFYRTINFCNTVIDLAPAVLNEDPTLEEEQLENYLSEALAIRAYLYLTLAKTFKDVPLKLEATLNDTDNFQLPTTPQEEVFRQVAEDLSLAEEYAVEEYETIPENKGRITKYAINAMQTEVFLWLNDFDNALIAANKIIDSGNFELIPASNSWFGTVYGEGNSSESIFELQYSNQNLNSFINVFFQRAEYRASAVAVSDVFGIDQQNPENQDIRGERASIVSSGAEIYKFIGLNRDQRKTTTTSDTHWFFYRYADVLLMKAEALNELNRGEEAIAIIEEIRTLREALDLTAQTPAANDPSSIAEYILAERSRELAFEGKRWFDVLRFARRDNYARLDLILTMALSSAPPSQQQSIRNKLQDPNSHYLPINQNELFTNKQLVQNPFYN
ncbi:RagB/SusD family nutrient uptake outer membrane protein [Leeuwenhoekiella marinoflava]|uniref:RagB/SusD family nutrient uptake outer membrane protein n=1 Tax=Leeuwenhoekiella marinoflava TaxID=988 RepID=UPI003003985C